jgi:lycopene cyclase domain-containing protein
MILIIFWLVSLIVFLSGWRAGTYLSITLAWALPPIIAQCAFGADILWHYRKLLAATILPLGLYLSFVDALAISASTWTISPEKTTGLFIGSLPLEEGVFFFTTVILVSFGITLMKATESREQITRLIQKLSRA